MTEHNKTQKDWGGNKLPPYSPSLSAKKGGDKDD